MLTSPKIAFIPERIARIPKMQKKSLRTWQCLFDVALRLRHFALQIYITTVSHVTCCSITLDSHVNTLLRHNQISRSSKTANVRLQLHGLHVLYA